MSLGRMEVRPKCHQREMGVRTGTEEPPGPAESPPLTEIRRLVCPRAQVRPWSLLLSAAGAEDSACVPGIPAASPGLTQCSQPWADLVSRGGQRYQLLTEGVAYTPASSPTTSKGWDTHVRPGLSGMGGRRGVEVRDGYPWGSYSHVLILPRHLCDQSRGHGCRRPRDGQRGPAVLRPGAGRPPALQHRRAHGGDPHSASGPGPRGEAPLCFERWGQEAGVTRDPSLPSWMVLLGGQGQLI